MKERAASAIDMGLPTSETVSTLAEFANHVEVALEASQTAFPDKTSVINWYRGVGECKEHDLLPGLYRHKKTKSVDELLLMEREMIVKFGLESALLPPASRHPETDFERLFFMQHYGIPTRLLDWTANPFIALFFALTAARRNAKGEFADDAAVWIMNPNSWNQASLAGIGWGDAGPLSLERPEISGYAPRDRDDPLGLKAMHELPVAMYGAANTTRMFVQKGVFTIFGRTKLSMEKIFEREDFPNLSLKKLVVPRLEIQSMLDRVISIGYTDSVSYPDLHGLAMEIKRMFGFTF